MIAGRLWSLSLAIQTSPLYMISLSDYTAVYDVIIGRITPDFSPVINIFYAGKYEGLYNTQG